MGIKSRKSVLLSAAVRWVFSFSSTSLGKVMPLFSTGPTEVGWGNRGQLNPGAAEDFRLKARERGTGRC